jgi:hypothetical protein
MPTSGFVREYRGLLMGRSEAAGPIPEGLNRPLRLLEKWMKVAKLKKIARVLGVSAAVVPLLANAASSGSFTASVNNLACTINGNTGSLSAPITGQVWLTPKSGLQIKVPNQTSVVITPSLVTGIYTNNNIDKLNSNSLQNAGLFVQVTIVPTGPVSSPISISPNTTATGGTGTQSLCTLPAGAPAGSVTSCAIYDQRFIQVQSGVLSSLAASCTTDSTGMMSCPSAFSLTESTLSAHAFNWYANLPASGTYNVIVTANLVDPGSQLTSGSSAVCAGPGTVTVTQVNNFSFNTPAQF